MADVDELNIPDDPGTTDKKDDVDADTNYAPTTVLILLGSMHFEHAGNADVLSLKIASPDERSETLSAASTKVTPNTLEAVHVVLKSSAISSLFDESVLSTFYDGLIPGTGEVMVHVLPESSVLAEDMPVQANDVEAIRTGLIMAGLRLEMEQAQDGSWILSATKPGPPEDNENDDDDDDDVAAKEDDSEEPIGES
jgi:hypothetical protein